MLEALRFLPTSRRLKADIERTRKLFSGRFAWTAMDKLQIPGHGTNLIRLDFQPSAVEALSAQETTWPLPALTKLFEREIEQYRLLLESLLPYAKLTQDWPELCPSDTSVKPWKKNDFLTRFDLATIYGMIRHHKPSRYLEVGSGMSTRVANQARIDGGFEMEIISVDPEPRIEVEGICDQIIRKPLELALDELAKNISPSTLLFIDGSHRCFPMSDVTVFFLSIMTHLPAGVLIHIHDVYLPHDYPDNLKSRYWSEQYLLAAYLMGGSRGIEVVLPCSFLATHPSTSSLCAEFNPESPIIAPGFWIKKTQ